MSDSLPNDLVSKLQKKPYVRRPDLLERDRVKFLLFGVPFDRLFSGCHQKNFYTSNNGLKHRFFQCGQNDVHEILPGKNLDQSSAQEELYLRMSGRVKWGSMMPHSGGNKGDIQDQPDLVVTSADESKICRSIVDSQQVPTVTESSRTIIYKLVKQILLDRYFFRYENHLRQDSYDRGIIHGVTCSETLVMRADSKETAQKDVQNLSIELREEYLRQLAIQSLRAQNMQHGGEFPSSSVIELE